MNRIWSIPRAFEGRTVAVLASGPSMSQQVADAVHAAGVPAIVTNSTFRLAPWAWMLYAADVEWWMHPKNADARAFAGLKASCSSGTGVLQLHNMGCVGYCDEQDAVHTFGNSGAQALQVAVKAGASKVLLCGFDMHKQAGSHWHGDHPAGLRETTAELYPIWAKRYETLAAALAERGVDVVNVTPGSALKCFRAGVLEEELASCTEQASRGAPLQA